MSVNTNQAAPFVPAPAPKPVKQGGAVDHIAAVTAMFVAGLGFTQIFVPLLVNPMTGFEGGVAAQIIAIQWAVFGSLLFIGGLFRIRVLTIFSAEFLLLVGLSGLAANLIQQGAMVPLMVHGGIALAGLANSGLARLTDKAELKRELQLLKADAANVQNAEKKEQPA